jgi:uncharacterized protein
MQAHRQADPSAFAAAAGPLLLLAPARHNLMLGIADLLRRRPEIYPTFHLWTVTAGDGTTVGAALQTPPHNVVIAQPLAAGALETLADAIHAAGVRPPGVVGALPEAEAFAAAWTSRVDGSATVSTRQGVYELRTVRDAGDAPGGARRATGADLDLVASWHEAFVAEAVPDLVGDAAARRRRLAGVIADGGMWLWEDEGRPVSMTGSAPAPPEGARIGPVYTPPADRRRGYATSLVAHVSTEALRAGRTACYLHTDLANPTSNAVYERIGYGWVCEAIDLRFDQSQAGGIGA